MIAGPGVIRKQSALSRFLIFWRCQISQEEVTDNSYWRFVSESLHSRPGGFSNVLLTCHIVSPMTSLILAVAIYCAALRQFRTKNERWAMRAEAAHQWRQFKGRERSMNLKQDIPWPFTTQPIPTMLLRISLIHWYHFGLWLVSIWCSSWGKAMKTREECLCFNAVSEHVRTVWFLAPAASTAEVRSLR